MSDHTSDHTSARTVDEERTVKELLETGCVVVPDVLTSNAVRRYREAIEKLHRTDPGVAAKRGSPGDLLHIENLPGKGRLFEDYFLHPGVLGVVHRLIGDDCVLRDAWSLSLPPTDSVASRLKRVFGSLHCEDAVSVSEIVLSVTTTYPLVDFTVENGATLVVPGSHRRGRLPERDARDEAVPVEAPAGSCVMMLGALWHAAGENHSDQLRIAMGAYYARAWIRPFFDFTRALPHEVLHRATPAARRLYGLHVQPPYVERWMWDGVHGRPKPEFQEQLRARGLGDCCLPDY
ncbi:MAG TPA: phytanoyl-CoA dioxygenase family protein [Micromonosporaceae bacterium]|nr:phytanoyl-CoA dioxygenase family protein [Micromonosporaceae bacterium]